MSAPVARRFIAAGALLFLLGLLTGFVIPEFTNPRMGLASHLEGVMNGTFLIALGAAWSHLSLSPRLQSTAFWLLLYGSFANWGFVTLAALFGSSEMTPIAGAGHAASAAQEQLVSLGLVSVGLAMLAGTAILLAGLFRRNDG
jgi:hydroxylaminobenzene mutase